MGRRVKKGVAERLCDQLTKALRGWPGQAEAVVESSRNWSSITFDGGCHRIRLLLQGRDAAEAADGLLAHLDDNRLDWPGHWVSKVSVFADERAHDRVRLGLDAVTVENKEAL